MTEIDIEYCVPCGLREHATETQERLLEEFGRDLNGVRLRPGHGGVFKVYVDDELVWNKDDQEATVDLDVITESVHERTRAHA